MADFLKFSNFKVHTCTHTILMTIFPNESGLLPWFSYSICFKTEPLRIFHAGFYTVTQPTVPNSWSQY